MSGHWKSSQGGGEGGERGKQREGARRAGFQSPSYSGTACPGSLRLPGSQPGLWTPKQGPGRQPSRVRRRVPGALGPRPRRGPPSVPCRRSEVGREGKGGKSLWEVEGSGWAALPSGCPPGRGGGPRPAALARPRPPASGSGCLHSGVSFKPGAEAGSRPSPAAPGQSPVKICWRTMAGKTAAPSPRPRCSGAGSLPSAPRPLLARLASWTDVPGEGATRARCPRSRRRGRAPHCFPPSLDARNVNQASRARPPPQLQPQPRLGPPTSAPAGLPLPRGRRRRRRRGRKNTGKLLSYLQRARAHTRSSSPWAPLLVGAAPSRLWPEGSPGF